MITATYMARSAEFSARTATTPCRPSIRGGGGDRNCKKHTNLTGLDAADAHHLLHGTRGKVSAPLALSTNQLQLIHTELKYEPGLIGKDHCQGWRLCHRGCPIRRSRLRLMTQIRYAGRCPAGGPRAAH